MIPDLWTKRYTPTFTQNTQSLFISQHESSIAQANIYVKIWKTEMKQRENVYLMFFFLLLPLFQLTGALHIRGKRRRSFFTRWKCDFCMKTHSARDIIIIKFVFDVVVIQKRDSPSVEWVSKWWYWIYTLLNFFQSLPMPHRRRRRSRRESFLVFPKKTQIVVVI